MRLTKYVLAVLCLLTIPTSRMDAECESVMVFPRKGAAKAIRLQVMADNIIRVEETPALRLGSTTDEKIPCKKKSLVIVPAKTRTKTKTWEDNGFVYLEAPRIKAKVDKETGKVSIMDAGGRQLLAEHDKSFKKYISNQTELPEGYHPSETKNEKKGNSNYYTIDSPKDELKSRFLSLKDRSGYSWHVSFDSPKDEAIYGLGQHQSEEMNYKGKNEELFQYNTKVSIPFVMSTAGYGLLWDSYSYGRWGNPDSYKQLGQVFKVEGSQSSALNSELLSGLTGTYIDKNGNKVVRQEDSLYFENSRGIVNYPKGFRLDGATVTYEGYITAPESNEYKFILYYAGYIKVYFGGHLVVPERWRTAWNPNTYKFDVTLQKDCKTPIRIEWKPDGGVSYCGLRVATPQNDEDQQRVSIWAEMDRDMDYYVIAATPSGSPQRGEITQMDEIIKGYRLLTGKAQVPPKWALGFWQSRERYKTQKELEETMQEFRTRKIPCDVIVQDWSYWKEDQWGSFVFDPSRYPDPQGMYDKVHALGGRLMISCWPKYYCNTANYKELDENGWMYQQAVKDSIRDWIGKGYMGSFYDAYSADARKMFWRHMDENLYSKYNKGMDAWWMDASEPNVRDCTPIDYRKQLCGPTALGTSDEYFNAYPIVNADAIYNGQRSVNPNQRVFLLTRSGFAGQQRYSTATWSGDIGTRWEDMRAQVTAGINFSMTGVPLWGMDIGGFCVENRYAKAQKEMEKIGGDKKINRKSLDDITEWRELQTRWNEMGCFMPLYRTHGQWPRREVWNIAPDSTDTYKAIVKTDKLRYRLIPYIYSMAGWVHFNDYTMLRGLAMDFTDDPKVYDIKDQWMFGPALMACPVMKYRQRKREVYLPVVNAGLSVNSGTWYDIYSGKSYAGGQNVIVDAPYDKCPVFVRAGSIIPFGPEIQYTDEKKPDIINLYVYAGKDGTFRLYEDEGTNYNYENGKYSTIDITYNDARKTVTIGTRKGSFPGMLTKRKFNIVLVSNGSPRPLVLDNPYGITVNYNGKSTTVKLN